MRRLAGRLAVTVGLVLLLSLAWALVHGGTWDVRPLARSMPGQTALMRERIAEAEHNGRHATVERRWVAYGRIAPLLRRAVLVAEDDAFYAHGGLDWDEIRASAQRDLADWRIVRGGSTITQQLAKNLFLGSARTPWRKLEEMVVAVRLERALTKRRIFELYLNVIEWGEGVYGAEAGARHWFGVPADALTPRQAVALAAMITNPRHESPVAPSRHLRARMRMIASRLRRRGVLDAAQYADVLGLPPPVAAPDTARPYAPADTLPPEPMMVDTTVEESSGGP
jgi:monofunctional glycosyltransferase